MPFIVTTLGTQLLAKQQPAPLLERLLLAVIPAANPDLESRYHLVSLWWIEINGYGIPQREIGFDGAVSTLNRNTPTERRGPGDVA